MPLTIRSITLGIAFMLVVAITTDFSQKALSQAPTAFSILEKVVCSFENSDDASTMMLREEHIANGLKALGKTIATTIALPMFMVGMVMSSRRSQGRRARFLLLLSLGILCLSLASGNILAWISTPGRSP